MSEPELNEQDWQRWRELCECLATPPGYWQQLGPAVAGGWYNLGKCEKAVPAHLRALLHTTPAYRRALRRVFYSSGWGWRLHTGWQERLEALKPSGGQQIAR